MNGVFIISPNGLGHFKRCLGWVPHLVDRWQDLHVHIAACAWQVERMGQHWVDHPRVHFHTGYTDAALRWSRAAADYEGVDLLAWRDGLADWPELKTADWVVSDNLVEVLALRPDALLMGSFTWGEVLEPAHGAVPAIARYVAEERRLLEAHRPPLLCVGDMVMPLTATMTTVVPLPWMTQRIQLAQAGIHKTEIAVLGGATPTIQQELLHQAQRLAATGRYVVRVPDRLRQQGDGLADFDFSVSAWTRLSAVVCRPGMGTLTDAVTYGVPLIAIEEPDNPEMVHNARRAEELGMGERITLAALQELPVRVDGLIDKHGHYYGQLGERPVNGYDKATLWLSKALSDN